MSYILEALKKLEENRRRSEGTSDLLNSLSDTTAKSRRRPLWIYLLVFALLLNAGLFSWWLLPSKQQVSGVVVKEEAPSGQARSAPASETSPDPEYVRVGVSKTPFPQSSSPLKAEDKQKTPLPAEKNAVGDEQKIYDLNDLPAQVRQTMPEITVSGHFFSTDQSSRIVVLNGKTLREGQSAAGGMRLEQITSEGVIISYQGYRFRKGVF